MSKMWNSKFTMFIFTLVIGISLGFIAKSSGFRLDFWNGSDEATEVEATDTEANDTEAVVEEEAVEPEPAVKHMAETVGSDIVPIPSNESVAVLVANTDDDDNKVSSGHILNDKRVGRWDFFHTNGEVQAKGEFVDDVRVGLWKFFHADGTILSKGQFAQDGTKTGIWTSHHTNGARKLEGSYESNVRVGVWVSYPYMDFDNYFWKGFFNQKGQRDGEWKWFSDGELRVVDTYTNGRQVGHLEYNGGFIAPPIKTTPSESTIQKAIQIETLPVILPPVKVSVKKPVSEPENNIYAPRRFRWRG